MSAGHLTYCSYLFTNRQRELSHLYRDCYNMYCIDLRYEHDQHRSPRIRICLLLNHHHIIQSCTHNVIPHLMDRIGPSPCSRAKWDWHGGRDHRELITRGRYWLCHFTWKCNCLQCCGYHILLLLLHLVVAVVALGSLCMASANRAFRQESSLCRILNVTARTVY